MKVYALDKEGKSYPLGIVKNIEIKENDFPSAPDYTITTSATGGSYVTSSNWGFFNYGKLSVMSGDKRMPKIKDVRFYDNKVTVVWFDDNEAPTRVVCKDGDIFSPEQGLAMAIAKKYYGSYERFQHSLKKAKHYEGKKKVKRG